MDAFIGFILDWVALPILLISAWVEGNRIRKRLGIVQDKSVDNYRKLLFAGQAPGTVGLLPDFFAIILYPFWRVSYFLLGVDETPPEPPKPEEPTFDTQLALKTFLLDLQQTSKPIPLDLFNAISKTAKKMLEESYTPPVPDADKILLEEWKANLLAAKKNDPGTRLALAFGVFLKSIPMLSSVKSTLSAPLFRIASRKAVDDFFYHLSRDNLFKRTRQIYVYDSDWGRALAGNVTAKLSQFGLDGIGAPDSPEHVRHNLRSYPELASAPIPIALPQHLRFEGTWIIAPQGRGKTTLLSALLKSDLDEVEAGRASIILMDSKGDLIEHVRELADFAPGGRLADKLTLIEPTADLAINPLDLGATTGHTIALMEYVFTALLEAKTTALQSTLFRSVLIATRAIPDATFATFRRFLKEGWQPFEQYVRTLDPEDADFFMGKGLIQGEFDTKTYRGTREELLWRIRDLTTRAPLLRQMFRAPKTKIDIGALMDAGRVIIIDNSVATLSQDGSEFFARFFIALILAAGQQRAGRKPADKLPVYCYLDEAHTVIAHDDNIATIIQQCRSQNIGMIFAHQELAQIKSVDVRSALANCAIRFANPDNDAKALAPDFRTDVEMLQGLSKGEFALFVRDHTGRPIIVSVPNSPVSSWPKMKPQELAAIRVKMRELYSFTPPPEAPQAPEPDDDTAPKQWG